MNNKAIQELIDYVETILNAGVNELLQELNNEVLEMPLEEKKSAKEII